MIPPIWLDEHGQRLPTRKCSRPACDREYPVRRYRYDHAVIHGWALYRVGWFLNWCGHTQEFIILPDANVDYVRLVPIMGQAR